MGVSEGKDRYRQIFVRIKNQSNFRYTNKQISAWTGFDESKISRFLNGRRDINAGEFFYLLESMPENFQEEFWSNYNPKRSTVADLATIIEDMDLASLGNLFQIIGRELRRRNDT